jgi:hypothetical protein
MIRASPTMTNEEVREVGAVLPIRDRTRQHPVPSGWRPVFGSVVRAFAGGDFEFDGGHPQVLPIDVETRNQIEKYVSEYGERITLLPEDTWKTSVCQWMGNHWEVLIDLWSSGSGRSDLVLSARVFEDGAEYRFRIYGVYVP